MLAIVLVIILWIVPIFVAKHLGASRGRSILGMMLGVFFGWLGVGIIAVLGLTDDEQRRHALSHGFVCPFCREVIRQGATVCPHCQRDVPVASAD